MLKPMLLADCRKERQSFFHSATPHVSLCLREMMHFTKLGASNLSGTCAHTLLGVVCLCLSLVEGKHVLFFPRRPVEKTLNDCHQLHM